VHLSDGQKERSKRALNRDCSDNEYTPLLQLPPCSHNGVLSGAVVRKDLIIFLFGRTFLIRCFNILNVCKQCSEMTVAPLSSNSTNKIPSLSQNTLPMILRAEA